MEIIDPGHKYLLNPIDGGEPQTLTFVKREGENYPGNTGSHPGILTQEALRACLDRALYMNAQASCAETDIIISSLRTAIFAFEVRAARCRETSIMLANLSDIDKHPTCPICGHIQCDFSRHNKPHWSKANPVTKDNPPGLTIREMDAALHPYRSSYYQDPNMPCGEQALPEANGETRLGKDNHEE
jgi:hypothetical protein